MIAHAYAEPPFRIGRSFTIDDAAYVIVVCAGPGVFAGDVLSQSVRVENGACAVLTSQSALQVHPASAPAAVVRHAYRVGEDAELHCHWDPVIPFADAAIEQQFDLALHASGRLYWSDALMSGRASRGEAWRVRELAHTLTLRVGGSLKYLERYRLRPSDRRLASQWIADAANYFATTLVHHPRVAAAEVETLRGDLLARLKPRAPSESPSSSEIERMEGEAQMEREALAERSGRRVEIDFLEPQLMIGRVMACNGVCFAAARAEMRRAVLASVFRNPSLAGRK